MKPLSKFKTFVNHLPLAFHILLVTFAVIVQNLPTTTPTEALVIFTWALLCFLFATANDHRQTIKSQKEEIDRLHRALEAATWSICTSHKESNVKS